MGEPSAGQPSAAEAAAALLSDVSAAGPSGLTDEARQTLQRFQGSASTLQPSPSAPSIVQGGKKLVNASRVSPGRRVTGSPGRGAQKQLRPVKAPGRRAPAPPPAPAELMTTSDPDMRDTNPLERSTSVADMRSSSLRTEREMQQQAQQQALQQAQQQMQQQRTMRTSTSQVDLYQMRNMARQPTRNLSEMPLPFDIPIPASGVSPLIGSTGTGFRQGTAAYNAVLAANQLARGPAAGLDVRPGVTAGLPNAANPSPARPSGLLTGASVPRPQAPPPGATAGGAQSQIQREMQMRMAAAAGAPNAGAPAYGERPSSGPAYGEAARGRVGRATRAVRAAAALATSSVSPPRERGGGQESGPSNNAATGQRQQQQQPPPPQQQTYYLG